MRFLWNGAVYRFKRVCFGISCAPFLLNATIRHHLQSYNESTLAQELQENFYVDDLLLGAASVEDAYSKVVGAKKIMSEACMPLDKWMTNSPELATRMQESCSTSVRTNTCVKVLGVPWDLTTDTIGIAVGTAALLLQCI